MIIQFSSKTGEVDFKSPVHMTERQLDIFRNFFVKEFGKALRETPIHEKERIIKGRKASDSKKWTVEEYELLLSNKSNAKIAQLTERSEMSVIMQRGSFVADYFSWAKIKGYRNQVSKELIQEFIKENRFV